MVCLTPPITPRIARSFNTGKQSRVLDLRQDPDRSALDGSSARSAVPLPTSAARAGRSQTHDALTPP